MQFRPIQFLGLALCIPYSAMAADCTPSVSNQSFQTSDGFSLLGDFQNNNVEGLSDHFELDATHDETVTHGTALVSIENAFLFENTHIAFSDVAFAVADILSQCCSGDTCFGGAFQIHGDSGLAIDVKLDANA